jgi:hypothetical protein
MQKATADIKGGSGKGFSSRLIVARRLARELAEPTERVWASGNEFASQLHDVDQGLRVIIEKAPDEIWDDPNSKREFCKFFGAIRTVSAAANEGLTSMQGMIDAFAPIEKMSRDLRPVIRRLRQGLTMMVEAREVMSEWVRLIEASNVLCDDVDGQVGLPATS